MRKLICGFQHIFNPLHVYCRLLDTGLNRSVSAQVCHYYEICIFRRIARLSHISTSLVIVAKERKSLKYKP
ncbi:MAG: hypothetical protein R6U38_08215 [Desulfatiglandaceae bacterium]